MFYEEEFRFFTVAVFFLGVVVVADTDHFCEWMLSDFNYNNETVMMAPASGFYSTENKGKNEVRIAYVLNSIDLKKAIRCLEEGLKCYELRVMS